MKSEPKIPPLFSPIDPAIHPSHMEIDEHTIAWAEYFRIGSSELRGRLVQHEIGIFGARIIPDGCEEVASLLSDFIMWLFGIDDGYCEEGPLGQKPGNLAGALHRLVRIAQDPNSPILRSDPIANGLRDLRGRMDTYGTSDQVARWVDSLREYFFSVVWEASYRAKGSIPNVNDYTLMRLYDGATFVVFPLLEMAYGYELQPHERSSPAVRAANEMASFVITWDNDILSAHKEQHAPGYHLNAPIVLAKEHDLEAHEALALAIAQRDRVLCAFMLLRDHLYTSASPQLRRYLDSLACFIRAAQDWGVSSVRYTTPDNPAQLPSQFTRVPTDCRSEPLDISAVSWWWDVLPAATEGRSEWLSDAV
ncbi:selina-4(15),7(11)-diene synthase [Streptomyces vinaceus]